MLKKNYKKYLASKRCTIGLLVENAEKIHLIKSHNEKNANEIWNNCSIHSQS